MTPKVITIDKHIPYPGSPDGGLKLRIELAAKKMELGDSFFLEGFCHADINPVLKAAEPALNGDVFHACDTDFDDVYLCPGVRVWRVLSTENLGKRYWVNRNTNKLYAIDATERPDDELAEQISPAEYMTLLSSGADSVTVVSTIDTAEEPPATPSQGGNYWKTKTGLWVVEYLPGVTPSNEELIPATKDEYVEYISKISPFTYWQQANGDIIKIPQDQYESFLASPRRKKCTQVTVNDYNDWVAENDDL